MNIYPKVLKFVNHTEYVLLRKYLKTLPLRKTSTTMLESCFGKKGDRSGLAMNPFMFAKFGKSWGFDLTDHAPKSKKAITQNPFECVVASMAMYLDFDYEELRRLFKASFPEIPDDHGYGYREISLIFRKLGYSIMQFNPNNFPDEPCLVTVPSVNIQGKRHQIFFNGEEIIDPQFGNSEMNFYSSLWGPKESGALNYLVARKRY